MTVSLSQLSRTALWALFIVPAVGIAIYSIPNYLGLDPSRSAIPLDPAIPLHLLWVSLHAVPASLALLIGPFQLLSVIRQKFPKCHRVLGRIYVVAVATGFAVGLIAAFVSTSGPAAQVGFVLLALAWAYTSWRGYTAARARRFAEHRLWMIRNVALTYSAVSLRLFLGLGALLMGRWPTLSFDDVYTASVWAAILVSVLVSEWIFVSPTPSRRP